MGQFGRQHADPSITLGPSLVAGSVSLYILYKQCLSQNGLAVIYKNQKLPGAPTGQAIVQDLGTIERLSFIRHYTHGAATSFYNFLDAQSIFVQLRGVQGHAVCADT